MEVSDLKASLESTPAYAQLLKLLQNDSSALGTLFTSSSPSSSATNTLGIRKMRKESLYLRVKLGKGSAFVGQLAKARSSSVLEEFVLHVAFKNTRLCSRPVECSVEPCFKDTFLFELSEKAPLDPPSWLKLVSTDASRLNICVVRQPVTSKATHHSFAQTAKELVASCSVDWRSSLLNTGATTVELSASGPESILHGISGAIQLTMDLVQAQPDMTLPCTTDDIRRFISTVNEKQSENSRDFYLYARDWWKSYQEISSLHATRSGIKIFAEDETGTHRSVCTFVEAVRTGRLIDR